MRSFLKAVAARLPVSAQQSLKRAQCAWQIRRGTFTPGEPEYDELAQWVGENDWVIDVGANVGHYTCRLSSLVGAGGRVIAFEPVPDTAALLAGNAAHFPYRNVSVFNAAASCQTGAVGLSIPVFASGLPNYYMASVGKGPAGGRYTQALAFAIDALAIPAKIAFVKIDAEGHELEVLDGMKALLARDKPALLVEGSSDSVEQLLLSYGYGFQQRSGSPNRIYLCKAGGEAA